MEPVARNKLSFRKLLERNLHKFPIEQIARRSYLIAINSFIHENLSSSLKIKGTNHVSSGIPNQQHFPLPKEDYNTFMPKAATRPKSNATRSYLTAPVESGDGPFVKSSIKQPYRSSKGFSVFQRPYLGQRQLNIEKKRSVTELGNPFYKIQKSRVAHSPFRLTEVRPSSTRKEEHRVETHPQVRLATSSRKPQAEMHYIREKSDTVQYQEVKHYFERKYG